MRTSHSSSVANPLEGLTLFLMVLAICISGSTCKRTEVEGPQPPPIDRDGLTTELGQVCISLRAAHCLEGEPVSPRETCYEHLVRVSEQLEIPTTCLIPAKTKALVRSCGSPQTLRFRCPD